MAGYALDTQSQAGTKLIGGDQSNALIGQPTPSARMDWAVAPIRVSGPSQVVTADTYQPMRVSRPSGAYPQFVASGYTSPQSHTWLQVGSLGVFGYVLTGTSTNSMTTNVSSSNTRSPLGRGYGGWSASSNFTDGNNNWVMGFSIGQVMVAGPDSLSFGFNTAPTAGYIWWDELIVTGGTEMGVWDQNNSSGNSGAISSNFQMSAPFTQPDNYIFYYGIAKVPSGAAPVSGAGTPGYQYSTYSADTGFIIAIGSGPDVIQAGGSYAPTIHVTTATGNYSSCASSLGFNPMVDTNVAYAGTAVDKGGGLGSWSNTANADGAPDGLYASWTAP